MQFSTIVAVLAGAAVTMAAPASLQKRQATVCTDLDLNPQCCVTTLLGVADLGCAARKCICSPAIQPFG
jgi:hypothetical protein